MECGYIGEPDIEDDGEGGIWWCPKCNQCAVIIIENGDEMNKLQVKVKEILDEHVENDYDMEAVINDLMQGGCQSGLIGELVYYDDTLKFYNEFKDEINELLMDAVDNSGLLPQDLFGDGWDKSDPLALDTNNQNLLAWFGFEETAFNLARELGFEI